jgi:hypothetical protein
MGSVVEDASELELEDELEVVPELEVVLDEEVESDVEEVVVSSAELREVREVVDEIDEEERLDVVSPARNLTPTYSRSTTTSLSQPLKVRRRETRRAG